jgi:hypothetical protein
MPYSIFKHPPCLIPMNMYLVVPGSYLPQVMQRYLAVSFPSTILPINITPPNNEIVLGSTILLHPQHWPQKTTDKNCIIQTKYFRQVENLQTVCLSINVSTNKCTQYNKLISRNINLLHVSAPACHPQEGFQIKGNFLRMASLVRD